MSAGKISCRWHRPDRFLGASQAGLTSRLTPQESLDPEDLSQVHDVVGGRSALLIARMMLTASRRARRPGSRSWQLQILANEHTTAEIAAGIPESWTVTCVITPLPRRVANSAQW